MNILAFDTATEQLAVAVQARGTGLARMAAGGAAASAGLLPLAHALLAEAGIGLHELQAIAFGRGPGAFTGLRTSCAVAQGLALGLGCPVLPVDSLLIVAEDARAQLGAAAGTAVWPAQVADPLGTLDIGVAMDARMGEIYAARWRWQPGAAGPGAAGPAAGWQPLEPARVTTPQALAQDWAGAAAPAVVAGSALAAFGAALGLPAGTRCLPEEQDRAAALLRLALAAGAAGQGVDAALALPLYVRDKVAQTTEERAALAAARARLPSVPPASAPSLSSPPRTR